MTNMIIASVGEDLEQLEPLYITSGDVKWKNYFRKEFGDLLES